MRLQGSALTDEIMTAIRIGTQRTCTRSTSQRRSSEIARIPETAAQPEILSVQRAKRMRGLLAMYF